MHYINYSSDFRCSNNEQKQMGCVCRLFRSEEVGKRRNYEFVRGRKGKTFPCHMIKCPELEMNFFHSPKFLKLLISVRACDLLL